MKCPLLTTERINAAKARGAKVVTEDTTRSLGFSNGASAFGIAVALGETKEDFDPRAICTDAGIYTTRGASSSGMARPPQWMQLVAVPCHNSRKRCPRSHLY